MLALPPADGYAVTVAKDGFAVEMKDQIARDRIKNDLRSTLIVEAAAGTGKTTALVGRILSLLVTGYGRASARPPEGMDRA